MRRALALAFLLLLCLPSLAADERVIDDCDYWRLGKDEAEKASRRAACDRIIKNKKHFSTADRAMAYAELASFAEGEGRSEDAIAEYGQAIALSPEHPDQMDWHRDRGMLLHFAGDHTRAIADFDTILAADPRNGNITYYRGLSYLAKGEEARGFEDLAKGIELDPTRSFFRYWRGLQYAKRGQTDAALAELDKAIALQSDDRDSYLLRAELYGKKGEPDKAIADLTRAVEFDPKYTIPYSNRALLYEQTGQVDRAIADYDTLLSLEPGSAYYTDRRSALLSKGAKPVAAPAAAPALAAPKAEGENKAAPAKEKTAEPLPTPPAADKKVSKQVSAGSGECRRFDAISNMTIAVACPD